MLIVHKRMPMTDMGVAVFQIPPEIKGPKKYLCSKKKTVDRSRQEQDGRSFLFFPDDG